MAKLGDLITTVNGRLTLTSGTPVTTSDVTAATTLYFTPYKGDNIALYDTEEWLFYEFTERSISLSGYAADTNFDVFLYDNSGTLTLETVAWTNDTTRATALTTQNGVYVKSGDTTRRYLGTIRTTSTTGQCEASKTKMFVWNYYNRVIFECRNDESTTHAYNTPTWRPWNNDSTVRIEVVFGLVEDSMSLNMHKVSYASADGKSQLNSIAEDSTSSPNYDMYCGTSVAQSVRIGCSTHKRPSSIGYHYYQALEYGQSATCTFLDIWFSIGVPC